VAGGDIREKCIIHFSLMRVGLGGEIREKCIIHFPLMSPLPPPSH
jgi:hypothetical protein